MQLMRKMLGCVLAAAFAVSTQTAMAQDSSLLQGLATAQSTDATSPVVFQEDGELTDQLHMPVYEWRMKNAAPRGIVLAAHGVAMHGRSYDYLGKQLAQEGYYVIATDMRGYGRTYDDDHHQCKVKNCHHKVNYDKSFSDLTALARIVRKQNPTLPIFGLGESLGGHMVIRLAAEHPELVDGLVLSAPAVRRHQMIDPVIVVNAGLFMANPRIRIDLMPFVRHYASDDPRVIAEFEHDPLLRRHMNVSELLQATKAIRKTISYVPRIPCDMPVLVIQGGHDRVLRADGVLQLLSKLHAQDQTVKWFASRGHILLETEYVRRDTMDAVVGWLNGHVNTPETQEKVSHAQPDFLAVSSPSALATIQRSQMRVQMPTAEE